MAIDIEDVDRRVQYTGSGTGPYNFTFNVLEQTDIAVYQDDDLLTLTTDYSVTVNADGTGSVTTVASMTGSTVTIIGARRYERTTDYAEGGDFTAETINDELDSILILIQQLREEINRSLRLSSTGIFSGDLVLPSPESGKLLGWNLAGDGFQNYTAADVDLAIVSAFIATLLDDADADEARTTLGAAGSGAVTGSGLTMATSRLLGRTTASTGAVEEISAGAGLALSGGSLSASAASDSAAGIIEIAIQSELESASSNTLAVTPGRLKYHPGVAKAWAKFDTSGNVTVGYNVSSITDSAMGIGAVNMTTSFSSANYSSLFNVIDNAGSVSIAYVMNRGADAPATAGAATYRCMNYNWTSGQDPTVGYTFVAFGDQ